MGQVWFKFARPFVRSLYLFACNTGVVKPNSISDDIVAAALALNSDIAASCANETSEVGSVAALRRRGASGGGSGISSDILKGSLSFGRYKSPRLRRRNGASLCSSSTPRSTASSLFSSNKSLRHSPHAEPPGTTRLATS